MGGCDNDAAPVLKLYPKQPLFGAFKPCTRLGDYSLSVLPRVYRAALKLIDRHRACRCVDQRVRMHTSPAAESALVARMPPPKGLEHLRRIQRQRALIHREGALGPAVGPADRIE